MIHFETEMEKTLWISAFSAVSRKQGWLNAECADYADRAVLEFRVRVAS